MRDKEVDCTYITMEGWVIFSFVIVKVTMNVFTEIPRTTWVS